MDKFLVMVGKIKWIGLIGIIGDITGNPYLELFWLLMLFGLVEIFYNLPVFLRSLKQTFSIPLTYIAYGLKMPSINNYTCKNKYILPFEGKWCVVNGGVDKRASHS